jgi:hypothetical protein
MSADELKKIRLKVQIWITSTLGLFSMGIIIFEPTESALVKWAIGIIGIIIGYWLK